MFKVGDEVVAVVTKAPWIYKDQDYVITAVRPCKCGVVLVSWGEQSLGLGYLNCCYGKELTSTGEFCARSTYFRKKDQFKSSAASRELAKEAMKELKEFSPMSIPEHLEV